MGATHLVRWFTVLLKIVFFHGYVKSPKGKPYGDFNWGLKNVFEKINVYIHIYIYMSMEINSWMWCKQWSSPYLFRLSIFFGGLNPWLGTFFTVPNFNFIKAQCHEGATHFGFYSDGLGGIFQFIAIKFGLWPSTQMYRGIHYPWIHFNGW